MRIQERLDDAVQALHRGSQGRLSVPVPHGVRIVAFRTVPEEDVSRIIADLENTAALLDEAERVVEVFARCPTQGKEGGRFVIANAIYEDMGKGKLAPREAYWHKSDFDAARAFLAKLWGECNILEETTQDCPRHGYSHAQEQDDEK